MHTCLRVVVSFVFAIVLASCARALPIDLSTASAPSDASPPAPPPPKLGSATVEPTELPLPEPAAPPEVNAGSVSQDDNARLRNQTREVDTRLTALDADELARIDRALEAMDAGDYGLCDACGCAIPFERLKIEPMTQHCVACKSAWEHKQGIARA